MRPAAAGDDDDLDVDCRTIKHGADGSPANLRAMREMTIVISIIPFVALLAASALILKYHVRHATSESVGQILNIIAWSRFGLLILLPITCILQFLQPGNSSERLIVIIFCVVGMTGIYIIGVILLNIYLNLILFHCFSAEMSIADTGVRKRVRLYVEGFFCPFHAWLFKFHSVTTSIVPSPPQSAVARAGRVCYDFAR